MHTSRRGQAGGSEHWAADCGWAGGPMMLRGATGHLSGNSQLRPRARV